MRQFPQRHRIRIVSNFAHYTNSYWGLRKIENNNKKLLIKQYDIIKFDININIKVKTIADAYNLNPVCLTQLTQSMI